MEDRRRPRHPLRLSLRAAPATTLRPDGAGDLEVSDSPDVELVEHLGGYYVVEAPLRSDLQLRSYHRVEAARADLLRRGSRHHEARESCRAAAALARNEPERAHLRDHAG